MRAPALGPDAELQGRGAPEERFRRRRANPCVGALVPALRLLGRLQAVALGEGHVEVALDGLALAEVDYEPPGDPLLLQAADREVPECGRGAVDAVGLVAGDQPAEPPSITDKPVRREPPGHQFSPSTKRTSKLPLTVPPPSKLVWNVPTMPSTP